MSYEPTNWKTGDIVTSAKLNKLEQGVASGGMVVPVFTATEDPETQERSVTCDMSLEDFTAAYNAGKIIVAKLVYVYDGGYTESTLDIAAYQQSRAMFTHYSAITGGDPHEITGISLDTILWIFNQGIHYIQAQGSFN